MPGEGRDTGFSGNYEDAYLAYAGSAGGNTEGTQDDGLYYVPVKKWLVEDPMSPLALEASRKLKCWLFPTAFTLFCFATYTVPVYLMAVFIGKDIHANMFLEGVNPRVVLYLPVLFLVTHVVHVCRGAPSRLLVFACLFGSAMLLMVTGDRVARASGRNAEGLNSNNCHSFTAKWELEAQWQKARTFYATCIGATVNITHTSFEDEIAAYRLRDCNGYAEAAAQNPGWAYLEMTEQRVRCAGWCAQSQAMWTKEPVQDSCIVAVADVMGKQIHTAAMKVVYYSFFVLMLLATAAFIGHAVISEWFGS